MSSNKSKIVFFGNERLATGVSTNAPTLLSIINAGYQVVAVVSHNEHANSRKQRDLEIAEIAKKHNIPLLLPAKPADIFDQLKDLDAEVAVLVAYGKIIPQSIIDIFPKGIINIHPSALPKHRGPTPIESVMLMGDKTTAVSVMQLVKQMDAGPVFIQKDVQLTGKESKQELCDKLIAIGSELILQILPDVLNDQISPKEQNNDLATFDSLIQKQDGQIDWQKTAKQIEQEIRAYSEWPKSYTNFNGLEVVITKAHIIELNGDAGKIAVINKELIVYCKQGALVIDALKPSGKPEMQAASFINGYNKYI